MARWCGTCAAGGIMRRCGRRLRWWDCRGAGRLKRRLRAGLPAFQGEAELIRFGLLLFIAAAMAAQDRVGDTGFVQLTAESFHKLTPREQALAYWLSQASIATDPIIYGQLSRFGLRQKLLLETVVAHPQGVKPGVMKKMVDFTKLFWANKGNHNELTSQKFLPEFTFEE